MRPIQVGIVAAFLAALSSCSSAEDDCEAELARIADSYDGPIAAFYDGDAYFALDRNCGVRVSGSYETHEEIATAWAASPYDWDLRPIKVQLKGLIREPVDGAAYTVFEIVEIVDATPMESIEEVNDAMRDSFKRQPSYADE